MTKRSESLGVDQERSTASSQTAVEALYEKLCEAANLFATLRQEPYFSSVDLDELVALAANARDNANWLRAQREVAESRLMRPSADLRTLLDAFQDAVAENALSDVPDNPAGGYERSRIEDYVRKLEAEIAARGKLYGEMCERLHACCQKYKLGLGR